MSKLINHIKMNSIPSIEDVYEFTKDLSDEFVSLLSKDLKEDYNGFMDGLEVYEKYMDNTLNPDSTFKNNAGAFIIVYKTNKGNLYYLSHGPGGGVWFDDNKNRLGSTFKSEATKLLSRERGKRLKPKQNSKVPKIDKDIKNDSFI